MKMNQVCKPWVTLVLISSLLPGSIPGCSDTTDTAASPASDSMKTELTSEASPPGEPASSLDTACTFLSETTGSGLTLVSEQCTAGATMVMDATNTVWVYSSDATADGWDWITSNANGVTHWVSDSAGQAWSLTEKTGGEFSLWVQVNTENGAAWVRTALPAAWRVSRDAAGEVWVWIDDHKVEVAVAAAVVAVVTAGLIVAPEGVGPAIVKGAVSGTATHVTAFLTALWNDRDHPARRGDLATLTRDAFLSIGKSVIAQCGQQVVANLPAAVGT